MTPEIWIRLMRVGKFAGIVVAITAAIVGVATAWPLLEPWVAAHRGYVREVSSAIEFKLNLAQIKGYAAIRDIQIEQAEGKRDQVEDSIFKWNIEMEKAPDLQSKSLIADRIRDLQNIKRKLDSQLDTLNKAHP